MMTDLNRIFPITEGQEEQIVEIMRRRDYNSEALSYIKNHSRTLNYWGEGKENLLPTENPGHYKFSFHDLVWLGIVQELREFGISKTQIFGLKEQLLKLVDSNVLFDKLTKNRNDFEDLLLSQGASKKDIAEFLQVLLNNKKAFLEHRQTYLLNYIYIALVGKQSLYLLINKVGNHRLLNELDFKSGDYGDDLEEFLKTPYVSLHLNTIIGYFLSKDFIQDELKKQAFTADEWKIIETIRKEKPASIAVSFLNGKVQDITTDKPTKIAMEARLSEIFTSGYEKITITAKDGKIVASRKQKKKKANE